MVNDNLSMQRLLDQEGQPDSTQPLPHRSIFLKRVTLVIILAVFLITIGGFIYKFNRNNDNTVNQVIYQLSPAAKPNNILMPPLQTVPFDRLNSLKRGVSISSWFGYPDEETDTYFAHHIDDTDLQFIQNHGFTHIRLSIAPKYIYDRTNTSFINTHYLLYIDQAIRKILQHHLAVIVDIHDSDTDKTYENNGDANNFVVFWTNLASHFSTYDQNKVFLELLNEPVFENNVQQWLNLQNKLIAAVRSVDSQHTIIATGASWGGIDGLLQVIPSTDRNIVYSFHYYEPFAFTHQGAEWGGSDTIPIANLQYPYNEENCRSVLNSATVSSEKDTLTDYCNRQWNKEKIAGQIQQAVNWSKKYNVPIWNGEYGVYCKNSPRQSKLTWIKDITDIFQENNIGWTIWTYDSCMGLDAKKINGKLFYDKEVTSLLGLK